VVRDDTTGGGVSDEETLKESGEGRLAGGRGHLKRGPEATLVERADGSDSGGACNRGGIF